MMADRIAEVMDEEWMALIIEARNIGLSIKEIREFLTKCEQVKGY